MSPRTRIGVAVVSLLLVGAGCAEDEPDVAVPGAGLSPSGSQAVGATTSPSPDDRTTGTGTGALEAEVVVVAQATRDLAVWATPQDDATPSEILLVADQMGGPLVAVVRTDLGGDWIEVMLPSAPAGHTGWVRRADVELTRHRFRIEISRSQHTLTVHAGEIVALTAPIALGTADAPPTGVPLFIKDLVELDDGDGGGLYGTYAYGIAGWANDEAAFEAEEGVVAIHGTTDPATLGTDVPRGSIAVESHIMTRMVENLGLPLGTPVLVVD